MPAAHAGPNPQVHVPSRHESLSSGSHTLHAVALLPHAAVVVPGWHVPFWQQPCWQFCELQVEHCPIWH